MYFIILSWSARWRLKNFIVIWKYANPSNIVLKAPVWGFLYWGCQIEQFSPLIRPSVPYNACTLLGPSHRLGKVKRWNFCKLPTFCSSNQSQSDFCTWHVIWCTFPQEMSLQNWAGFPFMKCEINSKNIPPLHKSMIIQGQLPLYDLTLMYFAVPVSCHSFKHINATKLLVLVVVPYMYLALLTWDGQVSCSHRQ